MLDMRLSEYLIDCFSGVGAWVKMRAGDINVKTAGMEQEKDDFNIDKTGPKAPLVKEEDDSSSRRNLATLKNEREQRCAFMRMRINLTRNH